MSLLVDENSDFAIDLILIQQIDEAVLPFCNDTLIIDFMKHDRNAVMQQLALEFGPKDFPIECKKSFLRRLSHVLLESFHSISRRMW